jgi:hypothetical protein
MKRFCEVRFGFTTLSRADFSLSLPLFLFLNKIELLYTRDKKMLHSHDTGHHTRTRTRKRTRRKTTTIATTTMTTTTTVIQSQKH